MNSFTGSGNIVPPGPSSRRCKRSSPPRPFASWSRAQSWDLPRLRSQRRLSRLSSCTWKQTTSLLPQTNPSKSPSSSSPRCMPSSPLSRVPFWTGHPLLQQSWPHTAAQHRRPPRGRRAGTPHYVSPRRCPSSRSVRRHPKAAKTQGQATANSQRSGPSASCHRSRGPR